MNLVNKQKKPLYKRFFMIFLFIKQRYEKHVAQKNDLNDTLAFSNHSADLVEEWASDQEDKIWT
jgi:hypothetical protein